MELEIQKSELISQGAEAVRHFLRNYYKNPNRESIENTFWKTFALWKRDSPKNTEMKFWTRKLPTKEQFKYTFQAASYETI